LLANGDRLRLVPGRRPPTVQVGRFRLHGEIEALFVGRTVSYEETLSPSSEGMDSEAISA
jgi:hypothetical protein